MRRIQVLWTAIVACVFAIVMFGCGGGGGGGVGNGSVGLFITDNLLNGYEGVWVTIYKVELEKTDGTFETVLDDTTGRSLNVRALNDGAPLYKFLGIGSIPQGSYVGARITVGRTLTLFTTGSTTGVAKTFPSGLTDPGNSNKSRITFLFAGNKTIGSKTDIPLDFDLANWTIVGSEVSPVVVEGSGTGLESPGRHEDEDYKGTISGLSGTSPNLTFTLTGRNGTFGVETNSGTSFLNDNGTANPVLANGTKVEVRGTFNTTTNRLLATVVKVEDVSGTEDPHEVKGAPSKVDLGAGTFDVNAREVEGFVPVQSLIHVVTTGTTKFFSNGGVTMIGAEFLKAISTPPAGLEVEVEGTYDANTNTLTATKVKIEDETETNENEAKATVTAFNAANKTLTVSLTQWFGFPGTLNQSVNVTTGNDTEYKWNGNTVTGDVFFGKVTHGTIVELKGTYNAGTFSAIRVKNDD